MRKLIITLLIVLSLVSVCLPAYASEVEVSTTAASESVIEPRADVIVVYYRVVSGVYQYRRWNETQGYWVDPDWIDM